MSTIFRDLVNHLSCQPHKPADIDIFAAIEAKVLGWSQPFHYTFFSRLLTDERIKDVLICGVYHGLDLALIGHALQVSGRKDVRVTGVDLFSDGPCADWPLPWKAVPPGRQHLTWEEVWKCPPPSMEIAKANAPWATLIKGDSSTFMQQSAQAFDAIYLDTAHDENTVRLEIASARGALRPGGILAGDDYNWAGVTTAVHTLLPHHLVMFNRIWLSQLS